MKKTKKILIAGVGGVLALSTLTLAVSCGDKEPSKEDDKESSLEKIISELNNITVDEVKLMDNVGNLYSNDPKAASNLKLINPSFVTDNSLDFNLQKSSNDFFKKVSDSLTITLKQGSLKTSDKTGEIEYTVVFTVVGTNKIVEKNIKYDSLNKNDDTQYKINKFAKEGEGDISKKIISESILKDVDVSVVTKWPSDLSMIDWEGVIGLSDTNTPFQGNISTLVIYNSTLNGVDVSTVTTWPRRLDGIKWGGVDGLSDTNTPFRKDISNSFDITGSNLKDIDVSGVTKWPDDLTGVVWTDVVSTLTHKPSNWTKVVWDLVIQNKKN